MRTWMLLALLAPLGSAQQGYVGSQTCAGCHEEQAKWIRGSVHDGAQRGCEACHGPGVKHVDNPLPETIINFKKETAAMRSGQCLACHGASGSTVNFRRSDHHTGKVACDQCHSGAEKFHRMRSVEEAMDRRQPELCLGCHPEKRADLALPSRHPVREGFMSCSSCHEPHGGATLRQLRTRGTQPVCGKCHEDKAGPFIFEHAAGHASDCMACHRPHGSTNPKMLARAQVRFQCLECHAGTTSRHDLTQARYQNCTVCHSRIHGSNLSRWFFE